jgi:hypothetical protein
MEKKLKVHEKFLYEIWKNQNFSKKLSTFDGVSIEVIDAGTENKELGGPDFKNARIKIGNITYHGDVEVDSFYSDWKAHGHNLNKRYNKVILHTVISNNSQQHCVYTHEGRKVQSISLLSFLDKNIQLSIQNAILNERRNRINKMPCSEISELLKSEDKLEFLFELGKQRFKKKSEKVLERLKEIIYLKELNLKEPIIRYELDEKFYNREFKQADFNDKNVWYQLIYEAVFEALGYSKNKDIMLKLAKTANIEFLNKFQSKENFILLMESILFNVGGLVPDSHTTADEEISAYLRSLCEVWNEVKLKFDGKKFHQTQWQFFKIRPQNFPTIRIAGGIRMMNKFLKEDLLVKIIEKIQTSDSYKKLANDLRSFFIIKGSGFWRKHYVFDQPAKGDILYFIGLSRADEIIINVILPIIYVYMEIFGREDLKRKIVKLYLNYYQKSENNLVDEVADSLQVKQAARRSVLYQGMIELFRSYCSRNRCAECLIGKNVF